MSWEAIAALAGAIGLICSVGGWVVGAAFRRGQQESQFVTRHEMEELRRHAASVEALTRAETDLQRQISVIRESYTPRAELALSISGLRDQLADLKQDVGEIRQDVRSIASRTPSPDARRGP